MTTDEVKALSVGGTLHIEQWKGTAAGEGARVFADTVTVAEVTSEKIRCEWTPEEGAGGSLTILLKKDGVANPDIDIPPGGGRYVFLKP
jgi:hypothetical protein